MKGWFGVVSLLVALAVVGVLASRRLKTTTAATTLPAAGAASATGQTPQQAQQQVRDDVNRTMEQRTRDVDEAVK